MTSNNRTLPLATLLLAASALLVTSSAKATLFEAATFDEKVANAAAIVVGKVVKQESRFDPDKRWILTYTTLRVEKTLKGGVPQEITIVTAGGTVGETSQTTVGVPVFSEGSDNVVFVRNTKLGPTVLYQDQGAYDVVSDRGDRIVRPVATGAVHLDTQRGVAVANESPRTLKQFESAVQNTERRIQYQQMEMVRGRKPQRTLWNTFADNKWIIIIGAFGVALASIHLLRK